MCFPPREIDPKILWNDYLPRQEGLGLGSVAELISSGRGNSSQSSHCLLNGALHYLELLRNPSTYTLVEEFGITLMSVV